MPTDQTANKSASKKKSEPEVSEELSEKLEAQESARRTPADQDLTPTPVDQWGSTSINKAKGFIVELPSGNVARVRRSLDILALLTSGSIPNPLSAVVNEMVISGRNDLAKIAAEHNDPKLLKQLVDLIDTQVCSMMIEPRVSKPESQKPDESDEDYMTRLTAWEPEEGTLAVFQLDLEDKMYLFAVGQGAAADLERFREESLGMLDPVPASKPVVKPTKRTGGARSKK